MNRSRPLLSIAREFFDTRLVGHYSFDVVRIGEQMLVPADERRQRGLGKFYGREILAFGPWEICMFSSEDNPPLGRVTLRRAAIMDGETLVDGPIDPSTWDEIGSVIIASHQRKAS